MSKLEKCPCGDTPYELYICNFHAGSKYAYVYGSCCEYWEVEFRTKHADIGSIEIKELATDAWNHAKRAKI